MRANFSFSLLPISLQLGLVYIIFLNFGFPFFIFPGLSEK